LVRGGLCAVFRGPKRQNIWCQGDKLDDFITQEELRQISEEYKTIAGFSIEKLWAYEQWGRRVDPASSA